MREALDVGTLRGPEGGQVDESLPLVHSDGKLQPGRVLFDDPDRIPRHIDTPSDSDEIRQWQPLCHGIT